MSQRVEYDQQYKAFIKAGMAVLNDFQKPYTKQIGHKRLEELEAQAKKTLEKADYSKLPHFERIDLMSVEGFLKPLRQYNLSKYEVVKSLKCLKFLFLRRRPKE